MIRFWSINRAYNLNHLNDTGGLILITIGKKRLYRAFIITNGCYRLAPVEWSIGEAVGLLLVFSIEKKVLPRKVRENGALLEEFQDFIRREGIHTHWPKNN
ncbi:FAD-dependent oxidoreductase [Lunatibacter salilacus]|uniref:FAD-dependent oxidoreductase n=1 Tax=Lunatibacter salilacus TaxID=2483804 RepID=UPI00131ECEDC|nr:FAD-dependent oxidoreductase [Lunatibacter salilacus]